MIEAEIAKKCSVILFNEIVPRARKAGLSLHEFCEPSLAGTLARFEYEGIMTRKEIRSLLDDRVKVLQKNDNI